MALGGFGLAALIVAVIVDWRRGLYLLVMTLPFEAYLGSLFNLGTRLLGAMTVASFLLAAALRPSLAQRFIQVARRRAVWLFALLVLWAFCSALWALAPIEAMTTGGTYLGLLVLMLLVGVLSPRDASRLWTVIMLSAVVSVMIAGITSAAGTRIAAPDANPNDYAGLLVVVSAMALFGFRRNWGFLALPVFVFGVLASGSRTALVAEVCLLVAMPVAGALLPSVTGRGRAAARATIVLSLVLVAAAGVLAKAPLVETIFQRRVQSVNLPTDVSLTGRMHFWHAGWDAFSQRPLLGVGAGSFRLANERLTGNMMVAHNMWVEQAAELGLVGIGLFLCFFLYLVRDGVRVIRSSSVGFGFVGAMFAWGVIGTAGSWSRAKIGFVVAGSILALVDNLSPTQASSHLGESERLPPRTTLLV